ncbi:MAG TPA: hypothetical protein DDX92_04820 [Flavobacteriales bacterium]|jgi:protein gp37|nr:hypothetical protein [Flavobacteriales bacterium]
MAQTKIEWTDTTWNPVTGCTPISDGCQNCYALKMAKRLKAMGCKRYDNGFQVTLHPDLLGVPLKWRKPRMVFANSMGDIFHEDVSFEFIQRIFDTMTKADRHVFQVLTKRSSRMLELSKKLSIPTNVWMGVTIESGKYSYRADNLRQIKAQTKFLSIEPMIGPINALNLDGIDWVITGGESGAKARAIKESWVLAIRDNCITNRVPFFFKQWGGPNKKKTGKLLQGKVWHQYPDYTLQRN